jgi:transposase-like protein
MELRESVECWRQRDLSREKIKYLFFDRAPFAMRLEGKVEKIPVLGALGVNEQGTKLVLTRVPKKLKEAVVGTLRSIFSAAS